MESEKSKDPPLTDVPGPEPSTPEINKSNKLLQELSQGRHNEKQVKLHNAELIGRNMALHDRSQEIVERLKKTTERNAMLIKENAKLYRTLRMLRLKLKELEGTEVQPEVTETQPSGLDTLAEVATIPEEVTPVEAQQEQLVEAQQEHPVEAQQRQTKRVTRKKGAAAKKS